MENFGLFCDGYLNSKIKNKECCYAYHLMTNCIYDVQSRTSCNKLNNYCIKHLAQSEYMIRMSPVDKLIGENRKKMNTTGKHTSVVPLVDEKPVTITPRRRNGKSVWKECFSEKRQSRRLSNLPPLEIVIKSENKEVKSLYDENSFKIFGSSIKIETEKQIKCEVIDDTDSNNQEVVNQSLTPDILLNKEQNSKQSKEQGRQLEREKIKNEPDDNFSLLSLSKQNTMFLDLDESTNKSWDSINDEIFDEDPQLSHSKTIRLINKVIFGKDSANIDVSFGQHESSSKAHLKITPNDETSISLNAETQQSQNNTVDPINDVIFNEESADFYLSFDQHESSSEAHLKITPDDETNISLNAETQQSVTETINSIDNVIFGKNTADNHVSFGQHELSNKANLKITPDDETSVSLNEETQQPLNNIVKPINDVTFDKDAIDINMPLSQYVSISRAHLEITPDDENIISFNKETQQRFKSIEDVSMNQNPVTNNSSSNIGVFKPLNEICMEIENNDLTREKSNQIDEKKTCSKSFPKLRLVSPSKLFKSPLYAKNPENRLTLNHDHSVTQTFAPFISDSNPNVTDSEQVYTNNYSSISYNNSINDNQNSNLETFGLKIVECWSMSTNDRLIYSEKTMEKTNREELANEIHPKISVKAKIPNLDQTFSNVNNSNNFEHTQHQPKQIHKGSDSKDRLSTNLTNSKKIRMETKTNLLPQKKTYSEMSVAEKKLYKQKLDYITALGLVPVDKLKNNLTKEIIDTKLPLQPKIQPKTSKNDIQQEDNEINCAKLKRSFILEFPNKADKVLKHKAVPVLLPDKSSGLSFHVGRTCSEKCSSCHSKFGLLDVPYHIAQIKNPDHQKACLESATHLVGPKSCLCAACFHSIEKQNHNIILKNTCVVLSCYQIGNKSIKSSRMDKVKPSFVKEGVVLRTWTSKQESIPICKVHLNQVGKLTQCQLCGHQNKDNFKVTKEEVQSFQHILLIDKISYELNCDLFICESCHIFLEWRIRENENISEQPTKHHQTDIKRINAHQKVDVPQCIRKKKKRTITTDCRLETVPKLIHYRMDESSRKLKPVASKTAANSVRYKTNKDLTKPTFQTPKFVPVLKPVDNLEFLSSFNSNSAENYFTQPPPNTIQVHPYVIPKKFNNEPLSMPEITPIAKTRKPKYQSRYMAFLLRREMELFNKLVKPYPSPRDFISHLLKLEKFRRTGHLVLANNPSKNTFVSKTILPSKVNNNSPQNNVNPKVSFNNSKNQTAMKLKVGEDCIVNEKRSFTQESKSQTIIPVSTIKHIVPIATLSKSIIYKPIQLKNNDSNKRKLTVVKVPNTMIDNIPKAVISNTDVSSKKSAISQFTVMTDS